MNESDELLVRRCRKGDAAAWEAIVSRYQRLVYSIPRRAGLDNESAADVFQQVFATLVAQLDRLEDPARLGAWLITTARRESWRVGRRESAAQSRRRGVSEESALDLPDQDPLPDEVVQGLEEQHAVRSAVESLDDRCRRLLRLLFYAQEPPSYAAIAASLGTSEGSIGPTRARCLQKLRRLLEQRNA